MRKLALSLALLFGTLFLGTPTLSLAAARGGGGHGGGGGSRGGGGGSRGFSGAVSGARGGGAVGSYRGGVGGYGGAYRGGYGGYRGGYGYGYRGGYGFGFGLGFGLGYPWYGYYGGYPYYGYPYYSSYYSYPAYDYSYGSGYYDDPGPVQYSQPAASAPPPASVYTVPQTTAPAREYQAPPPGRNSNGTAQSNMYLFAFPDGSVQVAVAYWTENGMLHYVTRDKQQKSCAITDLDQATTRQLNRERGVSLNLQ